MFSSTSSNTLALLPSFPNLTTSSEDKTLHSAAIDQSVSSNIDNLPQVSSKPLLVYRRRQTHVQPPSATVLESDPRHPTVCEVNDLPIVMHSLRRSARVSVPPDRPPTAIQNRRCSLHLRLIENYVRISDGAPLYALCRSWLRNGFPEENEVCITFLLGL
ncbi:hypothetical protein DKX38_024567 [Salix brachista]|uniref:Uncharacterized protein n=1 Tax=Salix brachista TaxID=2182728 RepID=A0A5N5JLP8_9ROSI|nr:hypothetical protein DKX38_024567 [Salix brachista]